MKKIGYAGAAIGTAVLAAVTACGSTSPPPQYVITPAYLYLGSPDGNGSPVLINAGTQVTVHFQFVNQHGVTMDRITTSAGQTGNINANAIEQPPSTSPGTNCTWYPVTYGYPVQSVTWHEHCS